MATSLPSPLAAALGIVPAVLDGVRALPGKAVQLPVLAVSNALSAMDALCSGYDDLAQRGEHLVARLSGQVAEAADDVEDSVEDLVGRTPFATAYDKAEDALESVTERAVAPVAPLAGRVRKAGSRAAARAAESAADAVGTAADAVDTAADAVGTTAHTAADADAVEQATATAGSVQTPDIPDAEAPKGVPTPKATEPDTTRVTTAASPAVQQAVDQAVAAVPTGPAVDHDDLPLPDYDHMTLGSLRGRLRALSVEQLVQIRTYEKAHADRLPIVTMLDNRIAKLATDPAAAPSGPVSTAPAPEQQAVAAAPAGPGISPATTDAPTINPPSQGDPTNPAQPR